MKFHSSINRQTTVFFALVLTTISLAAQTNYSGPIWALVDANKVLAAAADITQAKYPDCDDATVEQKMMRN